MIEKNLGNIAFKWCNEGGNGPIQKQEWIERERNYWCGVGFAFIANIGNCGSILKISGYTFNTLGDLILIKIKSVILLWSLIVVFINRKLHYIISLMDTHHFSIINCIAGGLSKLQTICRKKNAKVSWLRYL